MSASILDLQIANKDERERIYAIIRAESMGLSDKHEVSLVNSYVDDIWEVWLTRPDGDKISKRLYQDQGDLAPAVFRIRFRELLESL